MTLDQLLMRKRELEARISSLNNKQMALKIL